MAIFLTIPTWSSGDADTRQLRNASIASLTTLIDADKRGARDA